jgi:DNA-binding LytR/AlgR family response regulator
MKGTQLKISVVSAKNTVINTIKNSLKKDFPETIKVAGTANTLEDGVNAIKKHKPDIVLLDAALAVDLPKGILPSHYQSPRFELVLMDEQEAVKHPTYLKRPPNAHLALPIEASTLKKTIERIAIKTLEFYLLNATQDAIYGYYDQIKKAACVIFTDGKPRYDSNTLDSYSQLSHFFQVHKKYVVNLRYVKDFVETDDEGSKMRRGELIMSNGDKVDIAIYRKKDFLFAWQKYKETI